MDSHETIRIIKVAGGDTAFGKLLGIDEVDGFQQRVNNWKRRGMPPQMVLEHYQLIQDLRAKADAADAAQANRAAS